LLKRPGFGVRRRGALSNWATCRPIQKRGLVRALQIKAPLFFLQNNKIDVDFNFIELYKTKEQFHFIK